ncbi:MAG: sulfatase-like hydrolase/transferase [Deltaproteobacteria bacterium]|nr:sulfatase-like hydrolase/transferase [Deltaproteobacteria bacterium]
MKNAPWRLVLGLAVAFVGITDLLFLARSRAFLGIGYNSQALEGPLEIAGFVLAGSVCDAALILCLSLILRPLARRLCRDPLQQLLLTMGLAAMVPIGVNILLTRVHVVLGTILSLDALFQMAAGDTVGATHEALATTSATLLVVGSLVAIGTLWSVAGWIGRRFGSGFQMLPTKKLAASSALAVAAALVVLVWCDARSPTFAFGLRWKASGMALRAAGSWITDFDLDGAGMLSRPPDFAPFDGRRHPYARDLPGNGIDENGLAGDLPGDVHPPKIIASERPLEPGGSSLVLIFLETFRADLLHRSLRGVPVTPTLSRLATEAASSSETFTHSAMTWAARAQLFQGKMIPDLDEPTLVDDFKEAGYEVAWFSGQHDGARDGERILGFERADVFRDARSDPSKRTTPSTRPVSLQVSWKTVL